MKGHDTYPQCGDDSIEENTYILRHKGSGAVGGTYCEHALQELNSVAASLKSSEGHPRRAFRFFRLEH
jgi:hypothetical protein